MTKIPLGPHRLLASCRLPGPSSRLIPRLPYAAGPAIMAAETGGSGYPNPVGPPYPAASKEVELRRAMTASSRSGEYTLSAGDVVFEDEWMVVANKPSGVYCEALLSALSAASSSSPGGLDAGKLELHLANRLDRDTSGLMVITKSNRVAAKLVKAFTDHKVRKTYLALCIGCAPDWEKIKISSGHGRSKFGAWRVYSASDIGRTLPGGSIVKHMVTSFEVLSINSQGKFREPTELEVDEIESVVVKGKGPGRSDEDENWSNAILIRAYPQSGRTHQIRLHCQYLGIPIRGDAKYGVLEWKGVVYDAHALHAESLLFDHPITGMPVKFHAPNPDWVNEMCKVML